MKKILLLTILGATILAIGNATGVGALSGSQFNAGRIIDDSVFENNHSMSVGQIQAFLDSKVACDRWGTEPSEYGGGTRAQYGAARGNPAPYTCLNAYFENPTTRENNLQGRPIPAGGVSAAQLIYDVSHTFRINPQVLIVLLQKEQGLVTDEWPFPIQYRSAAGYGCPDTAACDSQYYGFYNQVYNAARQFRLYANNPNNYNHVPRVNNNVRWSPNASCGSGAVFIQNQSTASLYNYTPYQPNQAALNNLYGTGDGCSAYGNRNFWRYFNDWFGSTWGNRFHATFHSFSGYPTIQAGTSGTVWIMYRNSGSAPWHDSASTTPGHPPIVMASTGPINRASFFNGNWQSVNRPTTTFAAVYESNGTTLASNQHIAQPGQVVKFQFTLTAPPDVPTGQHYEAFQPVAEGDSQWDMGGGGFFNVNVTTPTYGARFYRMSNYPTIRRGSQATVWIDYKNIGQNVWYDDTSLPGGTNPIHLANTSPINRNSDLRGSDWGNQNRPAFTLAAVYQADGVTPAANQHVVQPGQIGRFQFTYKAPATKTPGVHREWIQPVVEGAAGWNMGALGFFDVTIQAPVHGVSFHSFSGYPTVSRGSSTTVWINYQNVGTATLYDTTTGGANPTNLANTSPINRPSTLQDGGWANNNRPSVQFYAVYESDGTTPAADQHRATPGQIIRYQYRYAAPSGMTPGTYREWIQPVVEMTPGWDIGAHGFYDVIVQ